MGNLVVTPSATLQDVPTVLRALADNIEAGHYGARDQRRCGAGDRRRGHAHRAIRRRRAQRVRITMGLLAMAQAQLAARFIHERAGT